MGIVTTQTFTLNFKQLFFFLEESGQLSENKQKKPKTKNHCIIKVAIIKYLGH